MMTLEETQAIANDGDGRPEGGPAIPANAPLTGDVLRERVKDLIDAGGLTQAETALQAGISSSALNQWLHAKYRGDVGAVEAKLAKWVALTADQNAATGGLGAAGDNRFVETPTSKGYVATLRYAQTMAKFGVIYGESGDGKTKAVQHYAAIRNNVFVCTCAPSDRALYPFIKRLAKALKVYGAGSGPSELTDAIVEKLRPTKGLLIVDEADHLEIEPIEQLRYIHDQAGVGVVLVGNAEVYAQLTGGTRKPALARLYSRLGKRQRSQCVAADVETVAKSLGVEARDQLAFLKEIAKAPGHLRNVVQAIQQGAIRAAGKGEALSVDHLETAWANLGAEV